MPAQQPSNDDGLRGDRTVRPDDADGGSAPAPHGAAPTPPTRQWQMTAAEQDMMACFRNDYLDMLGARLDKIARLVAEEELEAAYVALLSLESSSGMLGADALVTEVKRLRLALVDELPADADAMVEQVVRQAEAFRARLQG